MGVKAAAGGPGSGSSSDADSDDVSELIEAKHHRAEIVFGVLSFAVALSLATQIDDQTQWVKGLELVKQPALWPMVSIAGMAIFGALELTFAWRRNAARQDDDVLAEVLSWARAVEFVLWFMAYVWLVPIIGYLPATLVFCVTLTLRLGYRARRTIVAALLAGCVIVVVFKSLLAVKIPGGAFYEHLPPALRNFMILYL